MISSGTSVPSSPIIVFQCHGPDKATRMAELRLDTRNGAFAKRANGTTIVPGDLEASLLSKRITHENEMMRMPPRVFQEGVVERAD